MYYIPTFQKVKHIFSKKLKKFFASKNRQRTAGMKSEILFHRDALGQVPGLVHVQTF